MRIRNLFVKYSNSPEAVKVSGEGRVDHFFGSAFSPYIEFPRLGMELGNHESEDWSFSMSSFMCLDSLRNERSSS
jgi:hypothetical protein